MRIRETGEELIFENTLLEHFVVGSSLQAASVVFDRKSRSVRIRREYFRKAVLEIPYARIRSIEHWMVAARYFAALESGYIMRSTPLESHESQLSLKLDDREKEILCRRVLRMKREGWDGRDILRFLQGLADQISAFTAIPCVIRSDEIQGSFDIGARRLTLHGEGLPPSLKGEVIPFEEIAALRSTRTVGGYYAAEIQRKHGDAILTNEGFDTSSRLHETMEMIAKSVGIPFDLRDTATTRPLQLRPYEPISPTSRG